MNIKSKVKVCKYKVKITQKQNIVKKCKYILRYRASTINIFWHKIGILFRMALKLAQNTHDITIKATDCKFAKTLEYQ